MLLAPFGPRAAHIVQRTCDLLIEPSYASGNGFFGFGKMIICFKCLKRPLGNLSRPTSFAFCRQFLVAFHG